MSGVSDSTTSTPKGLLPFGVLSAAYFAHIGFFNPYLPLWLQSLGLSLAAISVLTSIQAATRVLAPYAWGMVSDYTGDHIRLLRICAMIALLSSLGLWWAREMIGLTVVLFVMLIHTSALMPMSEAAMAHLVSHQGRFNAHQYGRVRLWGSIGFLVTVLVAGAWLEHFGLHHFAGWALFTLMILCMSTCMLPPLQPEPHLETETTNTPKRTTLPVLPVLRLPCVQWFFAAAFFHVLAHMAVYVFLSLFLHENGYSKSTIGMLWALSVLIEIIWFFTQSRWLHWLSLPQWLLWCSAAMALRMGITANGVDWLFWLMIAQALHAFTFAAHHTACIALLSEYFPGRLRGRGQALYSIVGYGLSGLIGSLAGGAVGSQWGLTAVFWCAAMSSVLACICTWKLIAHSKHAHRETP